MSLTKFFHVAINSTDLDKSLAFYRKLGFTVLQERSVDNPNLAKAFGVDGHRCRFAHLRLGDDPDAALLDIVEWQEPKTVGEAVKLQNQRGISRFAVLADDADATYQELKAQGIAFITSPYEVMTPQGGWKVCLAEDPDGVVIQIVELRPPPAS